MKTKLYYIHPDGTEQEIHHVTSDTHIGHRNIAKYVDRPYDNEDSTDAMDADLTRLWNEVVEPGQTVLHLGDAALGQIVNTIQWYGKMNGTKLLVPGNHDYISSHSSVSRQERYADVYAEYFTVLPEIIDLVVRSGDVEKRLRASHYPYKNVNENAHGDNRYDKIRPKYDGFPLVHGHTHSTRTFQKTPFIQGCDVYILPSPEFHVGVEAHHLMPVSADVIGRWVFSL